MSKTRGMGVCAAALWLAGGLTAAAAPAAPKTKSTAQRGLKRIMGPDHIIRGRPLFPASFFIPQRIEFELSWTAREAERDDDFLRRVLTPRWVDSF